MHGIKGQRKVVANQSADALEVKQLLHQHHEVIDAIDHLDLHLPDRVLSWGLQADSWGVDNRIALKGFAAVVDRIRKRSWGGAAVCSVHLDAEVTIWATRVVAGGKDDPADGLTLSNQV